MEVVVGEWVQVVGEWVLWVQVCLRFLSRVLEWVTNTVTFA